jgi:hypothetical protein
MMITGLRPLSTSELLDRTFHLYRNHFWVFTGISAIPQLFILPLTLGGAAMSMRQNDTWSALMTGGGYLLFYLAVFVSQAPTVVAVSNLQMQKPVGIGSSYSGARKCFLRVVWIVFLLCVTLGLIFGGGGTLIALAIAAIAAVSPPAVSVIAGLFLTILPGYYALRWILLGSSLVIPATVLEGGGFLSSMRRSFSLSRGTRWRIFVIYFLMGVFGFVVAFLIEFLLMFGIAFIHIRNPHTFNALMQALWAVCMFASSSLVGGLAMIALSLVYYDQRVRKEAFDLQLMMATMGSKAEAVATAGNT